MEIMEGANNWKLTVRREGAGVTVLRAVTCDARAALPEELWGLPVKGLGDHALAPDAAETAGETVRITCGAPGDEAAWDNRRLEELTLPSTLERIGDYAFLNCGGLRTLALHDSILQWGGGALMNCRRLDTFRIRPAIPRTVSRLFSAPSRARICFCTWGVRLSRAASTRARRWANFMSITL